VRHGAGYRKRINMLAATYSRGVDPEKTYCYCPALDLSYPHYLAEHDNDHEAARELRASLAEGTPQ
jgi:hypothetical protein